MTRLDINLAALSEKINEQGATWTCGETSMTKLSLEEAKLRLGFVPPPGVPSLEDMVLALRSGKPQEPFIAASTVGAPSSYDLRNVSGQNYVTPIRDQGGCGSCVAFGAVAVLESTLRVALQNPTLDIDLSEAHLFYCHGRSQGRNCDNGWFPDAAFDQCSRKGLAFENSYPYTAGDQNCTGLDADWGARYVKLSGRRHLSGAAIKEWISTRGPVTGCFVVFDDFLAYRGGVYQHISGKEVGGHCVAIIGYDDSQRCWICKNSWGPNWGENGFFRIGYGECAIDTWAGPIGVEGVSILEVPSQFSLVSQTAGFGSLLDGQHPIWIADFTGVGHAQVMFYYAGDGNWWLADMVGGQLQWSLVSQTAGFGSLLDGQHPIWIADFTGVGHAQVMFYYAGDGNWWLADMVGGQLQWSLVSQSAIFGSLLDGQHPIWIADFTEVGHAQVMFYYAGDGNWWLGSF